MQANSTQPATTTESYHMSRAEYEAALERLWHALTRADDKTQWLFERRQAAYTRGDTAEAMSLEPLCQAAATASQAAYATWAQLVAHPVAKEAR